jgi:hypothetical protein
VGYTILRGSTADRRDGSAFIRLPSSLFGEVGTEPHEGTFGQPSAFFVYLQSSRVSKCNPSTKDRTSSTHLSSRSKKENIGGSFTPPPELKPVATSFIGAHKGP